METIVFLFVNATKIYHSKAKNPEIKVYPLCLWNIIGDFSANNMKKKQDYMGVFLISVDCKTFDTSDIINMHKYLMRTHNLK